MPLDDQSGALVLRSSDIVLTVGRHPLRAVLEDMFFEEGTTVEAMLIAAQPDPTLRRDAVVHQIWTDSDGISRIKEIPRPMWRHIRPKGGSRLTARILPYLRGGGGGGGKNPLRTILSIALIAATVFFAAPLGAALGFTGALASAVGGTIISLAGGLLINAIAPVPKPKLPQLSGQSPQESPSLFLQGSSNQSRPFDHVPQILGTVRFRPPLGANTFTEVLGDQNRLRMLMVVGYGELEINQADIKIGNTDLSKFEDFEIEIRTGTGADLDHTIYTDQIVEDQFSLLLKQVDSWQTRTSNLDADELSVDLVFNQGLTEFDQNGKRKNATVVIELEWSPAGANTWIPLVPADTSFTFDGANLSGSQITFTHNRSVAIRHGVRWKTNSRGKYDVRIRRITADTDSTSIFDDIFWATLRTFTNEDPLNFDSPLATIALDIRSSDQFNGQVDDLSVLAKSRVLDWNGAAWVLATSNNPASLFRHVLQGAANADPVTDAEIDLDQLAIWHDFCTANNFAYNRVHDFQSSVQEVLTDICSAGRAGLDYTDGKWSVVIDDEVATTTTHITPRNSGSFNLERSLFTLPDAFRVRFPNENKDYSQDERIVPRTGFTEQSANTFEQLEIPGVTNPDQIYRLARYHIAVAQNRRERWTVTQDFESIIARRGSRVKVTHDVMLVGLGAARIKTVTTNGGGDATSITVDDIFVMETAKSYGVSIRRDVSGDTSLTAAINTDDTVGGVSTLTFTTPIDSSQIPEVGDLLGFGEIGSITDDALVAAVIPENDLRAQIILVPYRPTIYTFDDEEIPTYTSVIGDTALLPTATIEEVITDESVLEPGAGDTSLTRAEIRVLPGPFADAFLEVQQRASSTGESYYPSLVTSQGTNFARVGDVTTGETWDFRVRWNSLNRLPAPWASVFNVFIIGKSTNPDALQKPTISAFGGAALIRWDQPVELDVIFGGKVVFRHSPAPSGSAIWSESVSIGQAAQANQLWATMPLKPGTYLARIIDEAGNKSDVIKLETKQASVLAFANVSTIDEDSAFSGAKTNCLEDGGILKMAGVGLMDDITDVDAVTNWDGFGGITTTALYEFAAALDLTTVQRVRLTSRVTVQIVATNNFIDDRVSLIDMWSDFDGVDQANADAYVEVRQTDDDPAGSPMWSTWERLDSAEVEARAFQFRLQLSSDDSVYNIQISDLGIDVEEVV